MESYRSRRWFLALLVYLAVTLTVSYAVWGPYDGVEPDWAYSRLVFLPLIALHLAFGAAVGWRALPLPLLWTIGSLGAEGYDTPVVVGLFFQSIFLWTPAIAVGAIAGMTLRRVRSS